MSELPGKAEQGKLRNWEWCRNTFGCCTSLWLAEITLAMREIISRYRSNECHPLRLRVGIHTGPVVAGVSGFNKLI